MKFMYFELRIETIGSLSKDDSNGNNDPRKQLSDWLNEEKNRAARAART